MLDAKSRRLTLQGPIAVYSDSGYELHTASASVDMRSAMIVGNDAVNGQGPFGIFRADRFRLDRHSRQVFLYGNVRMSIDAHGKLHS
jgi:lipopolysaccharide export system protein LptC